MTGIYGFSSQQAGLAPTGLLDRMRTALPTHGPTTHREWTAPEGWAGLGSIHPDRIKAPGQYAQDLDRQVFCVFDGILYRDKEGPDGSLVEPDAAALLLQRYLESGIDCLKETNGSFNIAWWDAKARRLVLANDRLGQRLLFYTCRNGALAFASLLGRVMAAELGTPEINVEGLADLLNFDHIIGSRTLFKDVDILPPACALTYEAGQVEIKRYWDIREIESTDRYDDRKLDELEHLFRLAVQRRIRPDLQMALDLTGGYDSRCILAAAVDMELPFITHTGGHPDTSDVVIAKQLAEYVGREHLFEPIGPERMSEWLLPMVNYQGGIVAGLDSYACQHFDMPLPFDASIQGWGRNYIRPVKFTKDDLTLESLAAVQSLLREKISSHTARDTDLATLWRPEYRDIGVKAPIAHLNDLFDRYVVPDVPLAAMNCLFLHERNRMYGSKAAVIVRSVREIYAPYYDQPLIESLAKIPVVERASHTIQMDLIRRVDPKLLKFPTDKTLLPMSASESQVWATRKWWSVQRRVAKAFRRPDPTPQVVGSTAITEWSRNEMRPALVDLIYNPDAAFRAYLDWETIKPLLDAHFASQGRWDHLVAALTVFEIAHRIWIQG